MPHTPAATAPATEAIGAALTADARMQSRAEFRTATMLIGAVVLLLVVVALLVWLFGLPALGIVGLVATAAVFLILTAYAAGW